MTGDAQTALLKALEDTPSHVYYILCTTEPQKLLPTIRGRCAQYQVQPLSEKDMKKLLRRVVKAEEESLSKEIYDQIVQDSLGHPRNALQILSQVLSVDGDKRLAMAKRTAETQSKTIELCRALVSGDSWKKVSGILKGLKDEDPEGVRRAVLGYCQAILLGDKPDVSAASVMEEFLEPFYNTGFPGLTFACYSVIYGAEEDAPF
jgi:DNA polymerase-3 subunit gamma/tau